MISLRRISSPVTLPRFAQAATNHLAQRTIEIERERLSRGVNISDAPAKPLSKEYAALKRRAGLQPIRDLKNTGALLGSRAVVSLERNSATVDFTSDKESGIAAINQAIEPMLGLSENDSRESGRVFKELVRNL